jgi:hypothetical protein
VLLLLLKGEERERERERGKGRDSRKSDIRRKTTPEPKVLKNGGVTKSILVNIM